MSYTAQQIHEIAISIIDEISSDGTIDATKTKDYANRAPYLLDAWQKELAKAGDLFKTYEISCSRKTNLLGEFESFSVVEHLTSDQSYQAIGANCFHFSVDSDATVTFEEENSGVWQDLAGTYIIDGGTATAFTGDITITNSTNSYVDYKGVLTLSGQSNNVRMTFSGNYYYRHSNRALCPYKFQSAAKVPIFKPWYKVEMPIDFKSRDQVIDEYPMWQYEESACHKWERNKDLYVQFGYEGIIRVNYVPIPAQITSLAQTIELDDITAMSGAYYLAEHYAIADMNDELTSKCRQKFAELKKDALIKNPITNADIIDIYGGGCS